MKHRLYVEDEMGICFGLSKGCLQYSLQSGVAEILYCMPSVPFARPYTYVKAFLETFYLM